MKEEKHWYGSTYFPEKEFEANYMLEKRKMREISFCVFILIVASVLVAMIAYLSSVDLGELSALSKESTKKQVLIQKNNADSVKIMEQFEIMCEKYPNNVECLKEVK